MGDVKIRIILEENSDQKLEISIEGRDEENTDPFYLARMLMTAGLEIFNNAYEGAKEQTAAIQQALEANKDRLDIPGRDDDGPTLHLPPGV